MTRPILPDRVIALMEIECEAIQLLNFAAAVAIGCGVERPASRNLIRSTTRSLLRLSVVHGAAERRVATGSPRGATP